MENKFQKNSDRGELYKHKIQTEQSVDSNNIYSNRKLESLKRNFLTNQTNPKFKSKNLNQKVNFFQISSKEKKKIHKIQHGQRGSHPTHLFMKQLSFPDSINEKNKLVDSSIPNELNKFKNQRIKHRIKQKSLMKDNFINFVQKDISLGKKKKIKINECSIDRVYNPKDELSYKYKNKIKNNLNPTNFQVNSLNMIPVNHDLSNTLENEQLKISKPVNKKKTKKTSTQRLNKTMMFTRPSSIYKINDIQTNWKKPKYSKIFEYEKQTKKNLNTGLYDNENLCKMKESPYSNNNYSAYNKQNKESDLFQNNLLLIDKNKKSDNLINPQEMNKSNRSISRNDHKSKSLLQNSQRLIIYEAPRDKNNKKKYNNLLLGPKANLQLNKMDDDVAKQNNKDRFSIKYKLNTQNSLLSGNNLVNKNLYGNSQANKKKISHYVYRNSTKPSTDKYYNVTKKNNSKLKKINSKTNDNDNIIDLYKNLPKE